MKLSLFSRIILVGVAGAATLGWVSAPMPPMDTAQAASTAVTAKTAASAPMKPAVEAKGETVTPGVHNRASWQPSPMPSQYRQYPSPAPAEEAMSSSPAATTLPDLPRPGAARPLPSLPSLPLTTAPAASAAPSPLTKVVDWVTGLFGRSPGTGVVDRSDRSAALPSRVVKLDDVLHHALLEQMYGGGLPAERGEWRYITFFSRALTREVTYFAWVPPGYGTSGRGYPTLYLLHGVGGEAGFGIEEWLGYALTENLERLLGLGMIEPMIVILPPGDQGYWMNHAHGGPKWADFVAGDLVKHVDATFRTEPRRERRAIGGLSMGGHGALQLALNHPDTFAIAGAHSPTIRPFETSPAFFGDEQWFAKYDPISLVRNTNAAQRLLTWIDIGVEDTWLPATLVLKDALAAKRAPVAFRIMEGEHEGWYWQYYLPQYLSFYSKALHATAMTAQGAPQVSVPLIGAPVAFSLAPHS